jgi:U3 small nucleolar RNA-associated protein 21
MCAGAGVPLMAAGGGAGAITVWNLEKRRLHTIIRDAHDAPITTLHFFPGEPRLMSAGADNALKQWVFDAADGTARLLRFRSGHAAPPTCLKHYGEAGTRLLSAGARSPVPHVVSQSTDELELVTSGEHSPVARPHALPFEGCRY